MANSVKKTWPTKATYPKSRGWNYGSYLKRYNAKKKNTTKKGYVNYGNNLELEMKMLESKNWDVGLNKKERMRLNYLQNWMTS